MENMTIFNMARQVPQQYLKNFNNKGFKGSDINPEWRFEMLTYIFGPVGRGWYYEEVERWKEQYENEILVNVKINLYVNYEGTWSKPIMGIGGNRTVSQNNDGTLRITDEAWKMALTDAISVSCKALGIGADVYLGNDSTKYTQYYEQPAQQAKPKPQPKPQPKPAQQVQPVVITEGCEKWKAAIAYCEKHGIRAEGLREKGYSIDDANAKTMNEIIDFKQQMGA